VKEFTFMARRNTTRVNACLNLCARRHVLSCPLPLLATSRITIEVSGLWIFGLSVMQRSHKTNWNLAVLRCPCRFDL
jgi:hypothetical protein